MTFPRRSFLHSLAALGVVPGFLLGACRSEEDASDIENAGGTGGATGTRLARPFGPLLDDAAGVLRLPEGFTYVILEKKGDEMSDGHPMGERPDGMACFEGEENTWVLMRNHENDIGASVESDVAYNPNMMGGVSRVVVDRKTLERVSSNWVLVGTNRNCAGGPSPWGWLSCEETEDLGHGYVFLCDPKATRAEKPRRTPSLGRFKHEAAAVDPESEIIYLTEDLGTGAFYRHVPKDGPFAGTLEALGIVGEPGLNLGKGLEVGDAFAIDWVKIEDPDATETPTSVQALAAGAAVIVRGEGAWFSGGSVYFVATEGGPLEKGQVFRLDPKEEQLTLIAQAEDSEAFVNPDNLTVSPAGEVFVVEDNDGPNRIWRVEPDGQLSLFAENVLNGGASELCGVCFSPDGKVLFVNIQEEGYTVAIRGPFVA